ncbi:MAG: ubiquitin-like small modifier protein 1 [Dehalococcoidia bacterium]
MAMQRQPEEYTAGQDNMALTVIVRIPTPLRKLTDDQAVVTGEGETLRECIDSLESRFPGIKERLCDETGELRRFVNVYINGEDVRFQDGLATRLSGGDEVSIVPAVAGG